MRPHRVIAAILVLFTSPARGQQPVHRVGVLSNAQIPQNIQAWEAVLRDRGYSVGWNLQIEYRYFQGRTEQIPTLLAELLTFGPEVIVTSTSDSAAAIHTAAPTIPLVFLSVADPIGLGLVESLAHPGGNVTGFATLNPEVSFQSTFRFFKPPFRERNKSRCWSTPRSQCTS
jgi:putative ABC transport system substrate-binding protein